MLASLRGKGPSKAADKDAIEIVLTEALVFVTPPRTGLASQGVEGDGTGKEVSSRVLTSRPARPLLGSRPGR